MPSEKRVEDEPKESPEFYQKIVFDDTLDVKIREKAIINLVTVYRQLGKAEELAGLIKSLRTFFSAVPKARTAKLVRTVLDSLSKIPDTQQLQIKLCKDTIAWTKEEKRTFLRHRIETKLATLYFESKEYNDALALLTTLLRELKRLDDKMLLVETHLCESQILHALQNLPKSKAALTAARTAANAIYCPPFLQALIDTQAGTVCAEEKDYKTAYSYFYEAFEAYDNLEDTKAVLALKYMLLCKIMSKNPSDVHHIIASKLKYTGNELDAMAGIATAYKNRSLKEFEEMTAKYKEQLNDDPIVRSHLSELYDALLEQNLCRLIEPFSRVEIAHIAKLIELPLTTVEKKLSQMILDKKFQGILDQGAGCLIVFDDPPISGVYPASLDTIHNLSQVVDSLYEKARSLS